MLWFQSVSAEDYNTTMTGLYQHVTLTPPDPPDRPRKMIGTGIGVCDAGRVFTRYRIDAKSSATVATVTPQPLITCHMEICDISAFPAFVQDGGGAVRQSCSGLGASDERSRPTVGTVRSSTSLFGHNSSQSPKVCFHS